MAITNPQPGFSTVFGVFQEYYSTHDVLHGNKGDLATVGTTSTVCKLLFIQAIGMSPADV